MLGQGLEPHVINEQQVGLQIPPQGSVLVVDGFILQEVPHQIENRGVQHGEAESDSGLSDGLSQVGLADARGAQKEDVGVFSKEASGGQLEDHFAGNSGVKAPVEVLQAFWVPEGSRLGASPELSLVTDVEFVLENEFEELGVGELVGGSFLQSGWQTLAEAGEAEFFEGEV